MSLYFTTKADIPLPIVFVVLLTVVLLSFTLTYFIIRSDDKEVTLTGLHASERLLIEQAHLRFYLTRVFNEVSNDIDSSFSKEQFVHDFREELSIYRSIDGTYVLPSLRLVDVSLTTESVEITDDRLVLSLIVNLSYEDQGVHVRSPYTLTLEKVFK